MKSKAAILLVFIMLASCSFPVATPTTQPSPQETNTPLLPPPTVTAIPSATITPEADLPEGCINLKSIDFDPRVIDGFIVVRDSDLNLFDLKTNQILDVDKGGHKIFYPGFISPNKEYMLAQDDKYNYILRTADQVIRTNLPIPDEWVFPRWLDNEHIAFLSAEEPKQDVIIFNPFTGEQQSIHLDLPNSTIVRHAPLLRIVHYFIDPSLKRVFYTDQSGRFILWDMETHKEMAFLPPPAGIAFLLDPFAWSPDGTKYVTPWPEGSGEKPLANELYVFNMNGKLEKLTDLNQKYAVANVESPTWSPNGRHIGFWLKIGSSDSNLLELRQWLAVLDTQTLETTVFCLADKPQARQAYIIVWSPDGQQLIVSFGSPLDGTVTPILVDLVHQTKTVIDTLHMQVDDWMAP